MFKEFKAFINRGNVLDLAVAVIIGAAFGKIVTSLTDDIIMPVIGKIFGELDFSNYFVRLGAGAGRATPARSTIMPSSRRRACRCSAMAASSPQRSIS